MATVKTLKVHENVYTVCSYGDEWYIGDENGIMLCFAESTEFYPTEEGAIQALIDAEA